MESLTVPIQAVILAEDGVATVIKEYSTHSEEVFIGEISTRMLPELMEDLRSEFGSNVGLQVIHDSMEISYDDV